MRHLDQLLADDPVQYVRYPSNSVPFVSGMKNHTKKNMEKQKDPKMKYVPYPALPTVVSITGVARATTKLKSH